MLTFQNIKKHELVDVLEAHARADSFIQGNYWEGGKGCAVGCSLQHFTTNASSHKMYPTLFGIPIELALLEDKIFEGLSLKEAKKWPLKFTKAIKEGVDLTPVFGKFQRFILVDEKHGVIKYAKNDHQRKVTQDCADLFLTWPVVDKEKSRAAADAAYAVAVAAYADAADAADAAAVAVAAYAADAAAVAVAAYAADAAAADAKENHYSIMADKLIELLSEVE